MLAKKFRLTGGKDFKNVEVNGKTFQSANFGIAYLDKKDVGPPRFAFVVSTKISKGAVHRNRINRSLHEGVRRSMYKVPKGYDFVFLAKRVLDKKSTEEIIRDVESFFAGLKL